MNNNAKSDYFNMILTYQSGEEDVCLTTEREINANITKYINQIEKNNLIAQNNRTNIIKEFYEFDFSGKKITKNLFNNVFYLNPIIYLNLSNNNIKFFPLEILNLQSLVSLNLNNNLLKELPLQFFSKLPRLEKFQINFNKLKNLPNNIEYLLNLKELKITNNKLQQLPNKLFQVGSLEKIHFQGNFIKVLPIYFYKLKNLKEIGFEWFKISYFNNYFLNINLNFEDFKKFFKIFEELNNKKEKKVTFLHFFEIFIKPYKNYSNNFLLKASFNEDISILLYSKVIK